MPARKCLWLTPCNQAQLTTAATQLIKKVSPTLFRGLGIFLPLITALIYVIARGKGMAQRDVEAMEEYRTAQVEYTKDLMKDASKPTTPADQIAQAKALLDSGAISEEEFDKLKAKALV